MPTYKVVSPVKIDGEVHKPGCPDLDLTEKKAAGPAKSGSLVRVDVSPTKGGKG